MQKRSFVALCSDESVCSGLAEMNRRPPLFRVSWLVLSLGFIVVYSQVVSSVVSSEPEGKQGKILGLDLFGNSESEPEPYYDDLYYESEEPPPPPSEEEPPPLSEEPISEEPLSEEPLSEEPPPPPSDEEPPPPPSSEEPIVSVEEGLPEDEYEPPDDYEPPVMPPEIVEEVVYYYYFPQQDKQYLDYYDKYETEYEYDMPPPEEREYLTEYDDFISELRQKCKRRTKPKVCPPGTIPMKKYTN